MRSITVNAVPSHCQKEVRLLLVWTIIGANCQACLIRRPENTSVTKLTDPGVSSDPCAYYKNYIEIADVGFIATALSDYRAFTLTFRKVNPENQDICPVANSTDLVIAFKRSGNIFTLVTPNNENIDLVRNPGVEAGFSASPVLCGQAASLLGIPLNQDQSRNYCRVQLDAEDQKWFAISIYPEWAGGKDQFDQDADKDARSYLASVLDAMSGTMDRPLQPMANISSDIDPRVERSMILLHNKFQMKPGPRGPRPDADAHRERNTCLRNARATGWIDLQAHFYCLLPHSYRTCYSTGLVEGSAKIADAPASDRIRILSEVYQDTFAKCFGPGGEHDFAIDFPSEAGELTKAFQHVNFVKQGLMDFNLEMETKFLTAFYERIRAEGDSLTPERPSRLLDPFPWREKQSRYLEIRKVQVARIKLFLAKKACAEGGSTWSDAEQKCLN